MGMPGPPGGLPPHLHQQSQINRQARRLYVGNIPYGISELEMMQFFNEQMAIAKLAMEDGEPIISSQINVEKNFAFLEFRNTEECTKAMMFDGIAVRGQTVKIRRPKDYQPPAGADPDPVAPQHVAGVISTVVADTPHKVYIGGLPFDLKDEHCKELLQTFGPLKAFHLVTDPQSGMSK